VIAQVHHKSIRHIDVQLDGLRLRLLVLSFSVAWSR